MGRRHWLMMFPAGAALVLGGCLQMETNIKLKEICTFRDICWATGWWKSGRCRST